MAGAIGLGAAEKGTDHDFIVTVRSVIPREPPEIFLVIDKAEDEAVFSFASDRGQIATNRLGQHGGFGHFPNALLQV